MQKIAIVYWSGTGNTEMMAHALAEGCEQNGATAEVFSVDSVDVEQIAAYDKVALGCPAMGDENLEEDEFQPFYDELKTQIKGKKVALFGSFSWAGEDGEGLWMQAWHADAVQAGLLPVSEGLICFEAPEDEKREACVSLGALLANA